MVRCMDAVGLLIHAENSLSNTINGWINKEQSLAWWNISKYHIHTQRTSERWKLAECKLFCFCFGYIQVRSKFVSTLCRQRKSTELWRYMYNMYSIYDNVNHVSVIDVTYFANNDLVCRLFHLLETLSFAHILVLFLTHTRARVLIMEFFFLCFGTIFYF